MIRKSGNDRQHHQQQWEGLSGKHVTASNQQDAGSVAPDFAENWSSPAMAAQRSLHNQGCVDRSRTFLWGAINPQGYARRHLLANVALVFGPVRVGLVTRS